MLDVVLTVILALVATPMVIVALGCLWQAIYRSPTDQDLTSYVRTDDGWRLAVHHYRPEGESRGLPLILCHGLSSNRYTFDIPGGPSLARFLRSHGRDVWVVELRGAGMSDKPGMLQADVPFSWGFEDHLRKDLPAIVKHVLQVTAAPAVHWIGHSMGGCSSRPGWDQ